MEFFPPHAFSVVEPDVDYAMGLLRHVLSIHATALEAFSRNEDESAWYPIVRSVLYGPAPSLTSASHCMLETANPTIPLLRVCEAQTMLLDQTLLPTLDRKRIQNDSVDFVVQLNPQHDLVRDIVRETKEYYEFLGEGDGFVRWSILDDVSVRESPTVIPVEVQGTSGEYGEGGYRVGLAGVALLGMLAGYAGDRMGTFLKPRFLPPVPAVVVVGHMWFLHWIFFVEARSNNPDTGGDEGATDWVVVQTEPIYMGSTGSVAEVFRLCKVVERLKAWAGELEPPGFLGMWRNLFGGGNQTTINVCNTFAIVLEQQRSPQIQKLLSAL